MSDRAMRELVRRVKELEERVHAQARASQAGQRSVEDGEAITFYDADGNLVGALGTDPDTGTLTTTYVDTTVPDVPSAPTIRPGPGSITITWDGFDENDEAGWGDNFDAVVVYGSDASPTFLADADTILGTITSPNGGSVTITYPYRVPLWVCLRARNRNGLESDPTPVVLALAAGSVQFTQDEFDLTAVGAQVLELTHEPLEGSEHLYWNSLYQRQGFAWTRDALEVTLRAGADTGWSAHPGDRVTVEYAWLPGIPAPVPLVPIGTSSASGPAPRSLPIPAGAAAGDLLVVVTTGSLEHGGGGSTDPRLPNRHELAADGRVVMWGFHDGTVTPLSVVGSGPFIGSWAASVLAVYRGVDVDEVLNGSDADGGSRAASLEDASAVLVVTTSSDGLIASTNTHEVDTTAYTRRAGDQDAKEGAAIFDWSSGNPFDRNPASLFGVDGSLGGLWTATLRLKAVAP